MIALILAAQAIPVSRWAMFGSSSGATIFIDKESVSQVKNFEEPFYIWLKFKYPPTDKNSRNYGLSKLRVDCVHGLVGDSETLTYYKNGSFSDRTPSEYGQPPVPDSVGEAVFKTFCPAK